jgi:hypothetical protein
MTFSRWLILASVLHAFPSWAQQQTAPPLSAVALDALRAYGVGSGADAAALGLSSADLVAMGVSDVADRVALLQATRARDLQQQPAKSVVGTLFSGDATAVPAPAPTAPPAGGDDDEPLQLAQEFSFALTYVNSTRQWGKCLHQVVRYRYPSAATFDYRPVFEQAKVYLEPSEDLPVNSQWELVNTAFVTWFMGAYNITSVSSQVPRSPVVLVPTGCPPAACCSAISACVGVSLSSVRSW